MTDNEIIKLLNECDTTHIKIQCVESILGDTRDVIHLDLSKIVDILNHQKAEIERLNGCVKTEDEVRAIAALTIKSSIKIIKAEAVKEFAERLKEKLHLNGVVMGSNCAIVNDVDIDNLVKEMVGDDNG